MKFRFIGRDGSLGLHKGLIYDLSFNVTRSNSASILVTYPIYCPYATDTSFWNNWELPEKQFERTARQEETRAACQKAWNSGFEAALVDSTKKENPYG